MRKCVVCGLSMLRAMREKLPVGFHRFPLKPELKQQWVDFCGTSGDPRERVCSAHFEDDQLKFSTSLVEVETGTGKRYLRPGAVPTIREGLPLSKWETKKPSGRPKGVHNRRAKPKPQAPPKKLEYVCRICQTPEAPLHDLSKKENSTPANKLKFLTSIEIRQAEPLPRWLCGSCLGRLNEAFEFVQKCNEAEEQLRCDYYLPQPKAKRTVEPCDCVAEPEVEILETEETVPSDEEVEKEPSATEAKTEKKDKPKKIHECETCQATFERRSDMFAHVKTHGKSRFPCKLCDRAFLKRAHLIEHEMRHKAEPSYFCPHCSAGFNNRNNLHRHVQATHMGLRPFACEECGKRFAQKTHYQKHQQTHVQKVEVACKCCSETFETGEKLRDHVKQFHPADPHRQLVVGPTECPVCHKVFASEEILASHKHREPNFLCNICGKKFTTKQYLKVHIPTHNANNQPYACDLCSKKFKCDKSLKYHMLVHANIKPFPCDECDRSFRSKIHLKTHKDLHAGKKPFQCAVCQKRFARKANMNLHLRVHHGAKPAGDKQEEAYEDYEYI